LETAAGTLRRTLPRSLRRTRRWLVAPLAAVLVSTGLIGFHLTDARATEIAARVSATTPHA